MQEVFDGRSASGKRWVLRCDNDADIRSLMQKSGVCELSARIAVGRGIDADTCDVFFTPALRTGLPDPDVLRDMPAMVDAAIDALQNGRTFGVFGDYDVDGSTAAALLIRYFRCVGVEMAAHIPDRISEGYGPNAAALRNLGRDVIFIVDCGSSAQPVLAEAAGPTYLIIDHHLCDGAPAAATATVNPNRPDDASGLGYMTAAGLCFLFLIALNRGLRRAGFFSSARPEPDLRTLLPLAALGTVCDVAPLVGVNRVLTAAAVRTGTDFYRLAGLRALTDAAQSALQPSVYQCGFVLGPRINAGGRVGRSEAGVRLLTSDDADVCALLADELCAANDERKFLEMEALAAAIADVETRGVGEAAAVIAVLEGHHPGVIGIAAARLREKYDRPAMVISFDGDVGKASGRSIGGVDLGGAVRAALPMLVAGGGHKAAAGFTIMRDRLVEFDAFMQKTLMTSVAAALSDPVLPLDGLLSPQAVDAALLQRLERTGPYGAGCPAPTFAFTDLRIAYAKIVGTQHVRCRLQDHTGTTLNAILFRALDKPQSARLLKTGTKIHAAGELRADTFSGGVQLQIGDYAFSD